jgi:lysophospholipase
VYLNKEQNLPEYYAKYLPEFIENTLINGFWQQASGHKLHYRYVVNPEATCWVVLMPGRAESVVKYAEVIDELYQNGCSVFAFDHIGQGQSSRLSANTWHGHIDSFNSYVDDAAAIITEVCQPLQAQAQQQNLSLRLLAHSMGGAIATMLLAKRPSLFERAALCAPMYGVVSPLPKWLAKLIVKIGTQIYRICKVPSAYFLGQGDYQNVSFAENKLTSSAIRYEWFKQYFEDNPDVQLGGITYQWLAAAIIAMDSMPALAATIKIPILILKAGADRIVDNRAIDEVCAHFDNANLLHIPGAEHEIMFEQDKYRTLGMNAIIEFLTLARP